MTPPAKANPQPPQGRLGACFYQNQRRGEGRVDS